ncbi:MAG TPA: protein kinase, partial [Pyrinomonadaceae bacterium]|nr:protein kinase [Pyrinomonadaceae bacterium]
MKECPACRHCFPDDFNNCPSDGDELKRSISGDTLLDRRYQLDFRLGQGGMGIVFKGRHIFLKTSFAIKVILPDLVGNDPMLVTRFRQEAMVSARIRHRNIVNVTDFGVANGVMPYLVMDFIKGKSLQEVLATKGRLSPEVALEVMAALCAGIAAAHREGIVHRDLKPLNIMIQDDMPFSEAIKVLDFGLAKIKSGEFLGSFVAAQTTGLMGSPFYMAPELWSDEEPDKKVDVYSLGIILFQILTNDLPFKGQTIPAIMNKHLTQAPPNLSMMGLHIPPAIDRVVRHALAKNPKDRLPSVEDFMTELREAVLSAHAGFVSLPTPGAADSQSVTMFLPESESGEIDRGITSKPRGEVSREELTWPGSLQDISKHGGVSREEVTLPDSKERIEHEADRLLYEFEEAQRRADEARVRAEAAARRRAEEEAERRWAEEEAARKLAEEEEARKRAEEAARKHAEELAAAKRAEEEAAARIAAEKARKIAEEEEARKFAKEEAVRLAREIAEAQRRAEEARLLAEAEARRRTEEEAARLRAEDKARQLAAEVAEMQQRADEARQRAEEESRKWAEQEEERKHAEMEIARERAEVAARLHAEQETARKRAVEEADRLAREIADAQRRAEEARQRAEEETRKRAEEEEARKRAEEEARRLAIEVAEAQQRVEEVARKRTEEEERTRALEAAEAQRLAEEAARRREAEEKSRLEAEAKRRREEEEYAAAIERNRIARLEQEQKLQQTSPSVGQTQPLSPDMVTQQELTDLLPVSNNNLSGTDPQTALLDSKPIAHPEQPFIEMPVPEFGRSEKKKRQFMLPIIVGVAGTFVVAALALAVTLYVSRKTPENGPDVVASPTPDPHVAQIDGGSFLIGRNDVSLDPAGRSKDDFSYDAIQYPANPKTVKTFWMDKTEVTNEEYADFVREAKYRPPAYWKRGEPPAGN